MEDGHTPLAILHCKTFTPIGNEVTALVGLLTEETEPPPAITLQVPTPTVGVFPDNVVELEDIHNVCEAPALEIVGTLST